LWLLLLLLWLLLLLMMLGPRWQGDCNGWQGRLHEFIIDHRFCHDLLGRSLTM
jgi:hypothetical protein